jgi:hypothetical protein
VKTYFHYYFWMVKIHFHSHKSCENPFSQP